MERTISLVGKGQTRFGEWWDRSLRDLIEEAVETAIKDSPCTALDIDMVIVANMLGELGSSQAQLGALTAGILPHRPPALRVEAACASGSVAIHTACSILESGRAKTVLVVGAEKMTDAGTEAIAAALMGAADAEKDAPSGITFPGIFGLIAARYMHEYGLTREDLNLVSAHHHRMAVHNPFAQFRTEIPAEHISRSPAVADPLCLLDCSPISDGAAAMLLSTEHRSPVRICASQLTTDTLSITDRPSITSFAATKDAMSRAVREAGIDRDDIACIELHDCFSIAAIINVEDLGFAEPGNGISLYRTPSTDRVINASGGLKACGHPVAATGIKQVIDVSKQLQSGNNRYGLAQNFGGAGVTCCVHLLENAL